MFTATKVQVGTYLVVICLFSISLLVFLNASISFIVTSILHQRRGVGNAVGTLGFADELLAIFACPLWGYASDFIGVRVVCVLAYAIQGIALVLSVNVKNVFPQLLFARLLFSLGASGTSTMITAILPAVTAPISQRPHTDEQEDSDDEHRPLMANATESLSSVASGLATEKPPPSTSRPAGFVGLFSGGGALIALLIFLRLPNWIQNDEISAERALSFSYYIVAVLAFFLSLVGFVGFRSLRGENMGSLGKEESSPTQAEKPFRRKTWNLLEAAKLGFADRLIGLAYVGGFVARASSVGITLFVPLFVNAYFISTGACDESNRTPVDIKEKCNGAYVLAAELTGVSQLVALVSAPLFGYLAERYKTYNPCLLFSAILGIIGYLLLSTMTSPKPSGEDGTPWVFVIMALIGLSQIGAIVCSLGLLGRCVLDVQISTSNPHTSLDGQSSAGNPQHAELVEPPNPTGNLENAPRSGRHAKHDNLEYLKGSIAGIYSLSGGLGILLLTKVGGLLFDSNVGSPFYLLAAFNAILLSTAAFCAILDFRKREPSQ